MLMRRVPYPISHCTLLLRLAAVRAVRATQLSSCTRLILTKFCAAMYAAIVPLLSFVATFLRAAAVPGGAAAPGGSIGYGASGAASSLGRTASGAAGGASRRQMSRRTSSARKWVSLRRMGSSAYSGGCWVGLVGWIGCLAGCV